MQSDIISEIIEVEDNASKLVEEARQKANRLIAQSEIDSNVKLKEAIKERRTTNHTKLEKLIEDNKKEISEFENSLKDTIIVDKKNIEKIASTIAEKICNSSVFDK